MKLLLYIAILMSLWFVPTKGTDVGELLPVEVVAVSERGGIYTVKTDTGDQGQGRTVGEAFDDLEKTAPGVIYLDTAEYLLVETEIALGELKPFLKKDIKISAAQEGIAIEGIADYLSVHHPKIKLEQITNKNQMPLIKEENGRYELITE